MGEIDMERTKNQPAKKQLGVLVDERLWREFRAAAIRQNKTASAYLEEAMRKALEECE